MSLKQMRKDLKTYIKINEGHISIGEKIAFCAGHQKGFLHGLKSNKKVKA